MKNLKKINSQQKHAIRIIFNKNKFVHTGEILKEQKILNIYQLRILSNVIFMHCIENPSNFSVHNVLVPILKLKKSRYRVSIRDRLLWNNILTAAEKNQESLPKFRTTIKEKRLSVANEINYF